MADTKRTDDLRRTGNHAMFDQMCWPIPNHDASYEQRYKRPPSDQSCMTAATEMDAYARLIVMPKRRRDYVIAQIRKAVSMSDATHKALISAGQ